MGSTIHGPSSDIYFLKIYILGSLWIKFEASNREIRVMWTIFNFLSKCFFWTPFLAAVWGFGLFLSADVEPKLRLSVWEQRARPCFLFWSQFLQLFQTKFGCSHGAIKTNFSFYPQNKIDSHYSSFSKWSFKLDSKTLDSIYFDKIYVRTWSVNSGLHLLLLRDYNCSPWVS